MKTIRLLLASLLVILLLGSCSNTSSILNQQTQPSAQPIASSVSSSPTAQSSAKLLENAQLFSGPDNISFSMLASLPASTQVIPLDVFGDFVKVNVNFNNQNLTGFVHSTSLPGLPSGLPQLNEANFPPIKVDISPMFIDPRALVTGNTITLSNNTDDYYGNQSVPLQLSEKWTLTFQLQTSNNKHGAISLSDTPDDEITEPNWKGNRTLSVYPADNDQGIIVEISDGLAEADDIGINLNVEPNTVLRFEFKDSFGKQIDIHDDLSGLLIKSLDTATLPGINLPNGLFPSGKFYVKTLVAPQAVLTINDLNLTKPVTGAWTDVSSLATPLKCNPPAVASNASWNIFAANQLLHRSVDLAGGLEWASNGVHIPIVLNDQNLDMLALAGFTAIRFPVNFAAYAGTSAPYTILPSLFAQTDRIVENASRCGLVTDINMMNFGSTVGIRRDQWDYYLALWKQIAEHFQTYPDSHVYFELLNEPPIDQTDWNQLISQTVSVIRQTNPTRPIIVPTCCYNNGWNQVAYFSYLDLPNDPNLIVTFHYYEPHEFTHQGASFIPGSNAWLGTTWTGTNAQLQKIELDFKTVSDWASQNNRPVFMGEFGSLSTAPLDQRALWTAAVRQSAEQHGFSWGYWDLCANGQYYFGLADCTTHTWNQQLLQALIPNP